MMGQQKTEHTKMKAVSVRSHASHAFSTLSETILTEVEEQGAVSSSDGCKRATDGATYLRCWVLSQPKV